MRWFGGEFLAESLAMGCRWGADAFSIATMDSTGYVFDMFSPPGARE